MTEPTNSQTANDDNEREPLIEPAPLLEAKRDILSEAQQRLAAARIANDATQNAALASQKTAQEARHISQHIQQQVSTMTEQQPQQSNWRTTTSGITAAIGLVGILIAAVSHGDWITAGSALVSAIGVFAGFLNAPDAQTFVDIVRNRKQ